MFAFCMVKQDRAKKITPFQSAKGMIYYLKMVEKYLFYQAECWYLGKIWEAAHATKFQQSTKSF